MSFAPQTRREQFNRLFFELLQLPNYTHHKGVLCRFPPRCTSQALTPLGSICRSFETIAKRATTEPEDSKEMFDLIAYMDSVRGTELPDLLLRIATSRGRLLALLDVAEFDTEDVALNTSTMTWPTNIYPVFDENALLLERVKARGEETLSTKRDKVRCATFCTRETR
jgi:hypothetical protein